MKTPDFSHLKDNEKKMIQAVIRRQKTEDDRPNSPDQDYSSPSISTTSRSYSQLNDSGILCQICQKTKFVTDQSSRQCSICEKRFCVRCGIRLKSHYYLCNQCRQKQEQYFSLNKNISKQYLSDYILSQTSEEKISGANPKRILPRMKSIQNEDQPSSPESISTTAQTKRLLPDILRDFQYHSLEERDVGQESTLKDSGIDTASSSTILNVISPEKLQKPMTYWRFNENRTEQIGYIYLKTNLPTHKYEQGRMRRNEIFDALGLQIQSEIERENELITEITKVISGSIADTCGQLRVGDQVLEWNAEKLVNLNASDVNRIISRISMQSPQIHMIVKRSIRSSLWNVNPSISTRLGQDQPTEKIPIQLQLSLQYDQKHFYVMIYGARYIPIQQDLVACQLSLQDERDISFKEEKCTKAQSCSAGICTWNQRLIFFDILKIDGLNLWIKLINLEVNQEILGEINLQKLNPTNKSEWYNLTESSFNRSLSSTTDIPSTAANHRKRQLPDIPLAQVHANRERVSQGLFQKATELKLRLHMQSTHGKSLINQHSFDQTLVQESQQDYPGKSMVNLPSVSSKASSIGTLKDKPRIPMIREKGASISALPRQTTMVGQTEMSIGKSKLKSFEEKYRKMIKKRHSLENPSDDGSDVPSKTSTDILPTQPEPSRHVRKQKIHQRSLDHFHQTQLNEEELRQMEMRPYETTIHSIPSNKNPPKEIEQKPSPPPVISSTEKVNQRNDGNVSDSALSTQSESPIKRRQSKQSKAFVILGLSKKANSSSSLGCGKRSGFQRSEEIGVQPHLQNRALERQTSKENEKPTSAPPNSTSPSPFHPSLQRDQYHSIPQDMKLWSGALKLPHEHQFTDFIEGLGTGQLVGRQVLASPCHGEIQIGLRDQHGLLEIEIVRARNLPQKVVYKLPPAPYVKVYLLDGKTCLEKQRTRLARPTLDPLIQQTLIFKDDYRGRILQISIWGDYGKLDRKIFMGVCQIGLEDVNVNASQQILDWYKLFSANSLLNHYTIVQQSPTKIRSTSTNTRS